MRGKKARQFRKTTRLIAKNYPLIEYEKVKQKTSNLKRIDRAIKYGLEPDVNDKFGVKMVQACQRKLYKTIKTEYKKGGV